MRRPTAWRSPSKPTASCGATATAASRWVSGSSRSDGRPRTGWGLPEVARPVLEALRDETGESVQLYVREGDRRVCVEALESPHGLRTIVPLGAALPLDAGSAGKILRGDAEALKRGWAESVAEREAGVASVSAPVRAADGAVIAAVSVSGPIERTTRQPGKRYATAVAAAAARIETRTQYRPALTEREDTDAHASSSAGTNRFGAEHRGIVAAVDAMHGCAGDRCGQRELTPRRDQLILCRDDHCRRDVDVADPTCGRELSHGTRSLEHGGGVVPADLVAGPQLGSAGVSPHDELIDEAALDDAWRQARRQGQAAQPREGHALVARGREAHRGRAEHHPLDSGRVPLPDELRDRSTHRVADRDEAAHAELVGEGDDVVGAVLETEHPARANAAAVAPVVESEHPVVRCEGTVRRVPVEVRGRAETVQQDNCRRARGTGQVARRTGPSQPPLVTAPPSAR